jgi:hypothetical protein
MPDRRLALIVGIDGYPSSPLHGCVNDATAMSTLLGTHADGSPNFDVRLVTAPGSTITRASLKQNTAELFATVDCDVALLYFSGHGTRNSRRD